MTSNTSTAAHEPARFLLLLPPITESPSFSALESAYGDTLHQVLREASARSAESPKAAVLEIGLACPHLHDGRLQPRATLYAATQKLLAGVYNLIGAVAVRDEVNIEDADGVDVRVLLVAWKPEGTSEQGSQKSPYGPVVDLETLAHSGRPWQYAFGVESPEGESMMRAFMTAKAEGAQSSNPAVDVSQQKRGQTGAATKPNSNRGHHYSVICGGTWDHLHIGHKLLISMTLFANDEPASADQPLVATFGITGDQLLVNKKHASVLEDWADRQRGVASFCNALIDFSAPASPGQRHVSVRDDPGPNGKSVDIHYPHGLVIKCTEIQDPYGPTITEREITALIVSEETRAGGQAVNEKRVEKGWHALEVFEVDVLDADAAAEVKGADKEGFESKISSTAIREKLARKAGKI